MDCRRGTRADVGRALCLTAGLVALAMLFVAECDDCYFSYWTFDSIWDFLTVRPNVEAPQVIGVPLNGRHLGNLLGVIQGRLYASPWRVLWSIGLGLGLSGFILLLAQVGGDRGAGREMLPLAALLVMLSPKGLWQQVYSWGSGYANYLTPILLLLSLYLWMRSPGKGGWATPLGLLVVSVMGGQFIEHTTLFLLVASLAWLAWLWWSKASWKAKQRGIAVALGAVLGAVWMFSDPRYQAEGKVHSFGLEGVWEKLATIVSQGVLYPIPVALTLSVLLWMVLVRLRRGTGMLWLAPLAALHSWIFFHHFQRDWESVPDVQSIGVGLGLAACWLGMTLSLPNTPRRTQLLWWAGGVCLANGPLLLAAPINSRMFLLSYALLVILCLRLYQWLIALTGVRRGSGAMWLGTGVALGLLFCIYGSNFQVYHQRLTQGAQQVTQGASALTLPLVPFPQFTTNEMVGKGDTSYQLYREVPWDVALHFVPYEELQKPLQMLSWIVDLWP